MFNGRRQPSCGGTSRMTRECHVRFCERLGVQFPGPTRQTRSFGDVGSMFRFARKRTWLGNLGVHALGIPFSRPLNSRSWTA
jgi:hypothetical protein